MLYSQTITVQPGQEYLIATEGDQVRYRNSQSSGDKQLIFRTDNGAEVVLGEGEQFRLPRKFALVRVRCVGSDAVRAQIVIGYGDAGGSPPITVTDAIAARVASGLQFGFFAPITIDSQRTIQLWNGGSKTLIVNRVFGIQGTPAKLWARQTQLAGTAITLQNRIAGSAVPSGFSASHAFEGTLYTPSGSSIEFASNAVSSQNYLAQADAPIGIPPGWGLSIQYPNGVALGSQSTAIEGFLM